METALTGLFSHATGLTIIAMGVFARISAALFFLPGVAERSVPVRVKLGIAFLIAFVLSPIIASRQAPAIPSVAGLGMILAAEALAGLVIGLAFRFLIFALQIAGTMAAQSISISHMFGTGVATGSEPTVASFLAMGGITIALSAGLHVHAIAAMERLYDVMPFGEFLSGADMADWSIARVGETFAFALSLALPFVAIGFAYNLALGALSRAMPQLLVALIGVPLLVGLGMAILWLALPEIFARWSEALGAVLAEPLGGFR